jgi:hypothetical protein
MRGDHNHNQKRYFFFLGGDRDILKAWITKPKPISDAKYWEYPEGILIKRTSRGNAKGDLEKPAADAGSIIISGPLETTSGCEPGCPSRMHARSGKPLRKLPSHEEAYAALMAEASRFTDVPEPVPVASAPASEAPGQDSADDDLEIVSGSHPWFRNERVLVDYMIPWLGDPAIAGHRLRIFQEHGKEAGREFPVPGGFIDLLAEGIDDDVLYVIEFKNKNDSKVVNQALGYIGAIRELFPDRTVKSIIIAPGFTLDVQKAARGSQDIELRRLEKLGQPVTSRA